jgi:transposase InsO family protein
LGITANPYEAWMVQAARNATDCEGALNSREYVIHDNDTIFSEAFRGMLEMGHLEPVRTSLFAPNMNAFAERWVRSIREECLDHFIFLNEGMLRNAVKAYVDHYNNRRPHQGLGGNTITPWPHAGNTGDLVIDATLGGLLKSARRLAA